MEQSLWKDLPVDDAPFLDMALVTAYNPPEGCNLENPHRSRDYTAPEVSLHPVLVTHARTSKGIQWTLEPREKFTCDGISNSALQILPKQFAYSNCSQKHHDHRYFCHGYACCGDEDETLTCQEVRRDFACAGPTSCFGPSATTSSSYRCI